MSESQPDNRQVDTGGGAYVEGLVYNLGGVNIFGTNYGSITYTIEADKLLCPEPPSPPDVFGGRTAELSELKKMLKAEKMVPITALQGLGGIGKTTLARQLAHELYHEKGAERCFRAVLWVNFSRLPE
ncbi:MAG TPA: NB-ARC domain-containing protein, partial [Chloroflexia bacterium]|nr:NB-ARC domain-containing protein [Chloroflexia bacterium]